MKTPHETYTTSQAHLAPWLTKPFNLIAYIESNFGPLYGRKPHRMDFRRDMLWGGWRPLLDGEPAGNSQDEWSYDGKAFLIQASSHDIKSYAGFWRTRRPLPAIEPVKPETNCKNHFDDGSKIFTQKNCCGPLNPTMTPQNEPASDTEENDHRARAKFLSAHGAPINWVVMTIEEVRTLSAELSEKKRKLAQVTEERDAAISQLSQTSQAAGLAEGKLLASVTYGVLQGWTKRANYAEKERDDALAKLALFGKVIESLVVEMDFDDYVKRFGFSQEYAKQNARETLDKTK
jgi:hypothetical protein